jgi:hypothetical protein
MRSGQVQIIAYRQCKLEGDVELIPQRKEEEENKLKWEQDRL